MDYGQVKTTILDFCGQSGGGTFETLVGRLVNAVYREIQDLPSVQHEQRLFTFASVVAKYQYGMPLYVKKILNIEDPDNDKFLWEDTARKFDRTRPGDTTSGTPSTAFSMGTFGVQNQPASDGTLTVVSDSALDTGANYKVRVTGFNTSGVLVTELLTLTGTSAVTTTNSYDSTLGIERIVKQPASDIVFNGNLTVKDDDSNTLAILPVWWDSPDYVWFQLYPRPDAVITYNIRVEMRKPPLVNNSDWPEFDQSYHDLLVWGVTKDLLPTFGKGSAAAQHRFTFQQRKLQFVGAQMPLPNTTFVFGNVQGAATFPPVQRLLVKGVDV